MSDTRDSSFDAVVVGSGIAGLRAAIEIGRGGGRVAILTKDGPTDSATDKAQGGLAARAPEAPRPPPLPRISPADLTRRGGRCAGIRAGDEAKGGPAILRAGGVARAWGGGGQASPKSPTPPQATGDGMAMAYRAG